MPNLFPPEATGGESRAGRCGFVPAANALLIESDGERFRFRAAIRAPRAAADPWLQLHLGRHRIAPPASGYDPAGYEAYTDHEAFDLLARDEPVVDRVDEFGFGGGDETGSKPWIVADVA